MLTHGSDSPSSSAQLAGGRPAAEPVRSAYSPLLLAWSIEAGGLLLFVAFGSVTVATGPKRGEWAGVASTWLDFSRHLPRVGHGTLLQIMFAGCLVTLVVTSLWAIWLALGTAADGTGGEGSPPA